MSSHTVQIIQTGNQIINSTGNFSAETNQERGGGGGGLGVPSYISCMDMCCCEGYSFQAV